MQIWNLNNQVFILFHLTVFVLVTELLQIHLLHTSVVDKTKEKY